jgi:hypothetical protein
MNCKCKCKLMQHLIEQETQKVEAQTAAQVMDMESDDNAL